MISVNAAVNLWSILLFRITAVVETAFVYIVMDLKS